MTRQERREARQRIDYWTLRILLGAWVERRGNAWCTFVAAEVRP